MILQALKEYYDRKAADAGSDIAPPGWERKEIPFLIVLDRDGNVVNIEDTREEITVGKKKQKRAKVFLVPQSVKRTAGIAANLLWDNPAYALGVFVSSKGRDKADRSAESHEAFIARIHELNLHVAADIQPVLTFLSRANKIEQLVKFAEAWEEITQKAPFLSFKISGNPEPVFRSRSVIDALSSVSDTAQNDSICLITGNSATPSNLHSAIKGVSGANGMGANIVGFNSPAFCSFGKEQGGNAPVSEGAMFAYTTALNTLLGKDSHQRMLIGDATTVFWAEKADPLETDFADFFNEPPKDDPDRLAGKVKGLYRSVESGVFATDSDTTRFYVLGLSPNAARLAIRFWYVGTVAELAARFRQWFDDVKIVHGPKDQDALSLWRYLVALAVQNKSENIPPNLAGSVMYAILEGTPYPITLLQAAVRRNRAEQDVTYPRAALIKAVINRNFKSETEGIKMSLDINNQNPGYRLGRLFAALERIQEQASPGINATIRDRFYGSASGTPATVFGSLMRLKNHHLAKIENTGARVNLERLLGEIVSGLDDFPRRLPLEDQGRFAIGYYHQRQDFFTKKETPTQGEK